MIQKTSAMGNWWLAASSQYTCPCITSQAEFVSETSNHPGEFAPLQPRFGALQLLAFPRTKITFEREEISDHQWDSGKYDRAADGDWENCVRSQGACFGADWGIIVLCTVCPVSCIFNKCLYFSYHMDKHFLDRPYIHIYLAIYLVYRYIIKLFIGVAHLYYWHNKHFLHVHLQALPGGTRVKTPVAMSC